MRRLYALAAYLLAPLFCAALLWRGFRERGYWRGFRERFGFGAHMPESALWVHAASVGEVQAAAPLVRELMERYPRMPLVITTMTPAGRERARTLFGEKALARFLPLDLPGAVRRFLDRARPRVAIVFETELWPNLFHECGRRDVPIVLASARISPRSIGRYRRFAGLFREVLSGGIVIGAQTESDAERFRSIGAPPGRVHVTGNVKFDLALAPDIEVRGRALRDRYAAGRPIWVAGSTHSVEEGQLLEAHQRVRAIQADALLVLVPRHPDRFAEVAAWLAAQHVPFSRRSIGDEEPRAQVLLVDTIGELMDFYAAADVAFVGGSLVPVGGHNLLEPAALGLPVLAGPYNFNSEDVAQLLIERGAVEIVRDGPQLAAKVVAWLRDEGERRRIGMLGREAVEANRGAVARVLGLVEPLLRSSCRRPSSP